MFAVLGLWMSTCAFSCLGGNQPTTVMHVFSQDATYVNGVLFSAQPRPDQPVQGGWMYDLAGAQGSVTSFGSHFNPVKTDASGRRNVDNARIPAHWFAEIFWTPPCVTRDFGSELDVQTDIIFICKTLITELGFNDARFTISGSGPSTMTVGATAGFTTSTGPPHMIVYDRNGNTIIENTALSVSPDGTRATFPFPTSAMGAALPPDIYSVALRNQTDVSNFDYAGPNFFVLGGLDNSHVTPFGVDAYFDKGTTSYCPDTSNPDVTPTIGPPRNPPPRTCTSTPQNIHVPILTLYNQGQIFWNGNTVTVGTAPVVVKLYSVQTTTQTDASGTTTTTRTAPRRALVVNNGSGSASIVDLDGVQVAATLPVGSQPSAAAINANETFAYVVNYGSGTLTEINLSTPSVGRTLSIGIHPTSVALDSSGFAWVGGQGYVAKVDLNAYGVSGTTAINGTVTSLAVSNGEGELVYTVLTNPAMSQTASSQVDVPTANFHVEELALSNAGTYTYAPSSASPYQSQAYSSPLPTPSLVADATLVSADFNNGMSISATPRGFVVMDLSQHQTIFSGVTSSPVRAIAVDRDKSVAYLTTPDSNAVITVPLPTAN